MKTAQHVDGEPRSSESDSGAQKNVSTLASRVQALPAEMYNKILELTFTSLADDYYIDSDYKQHSCLQVSKRTRSKLIKSYYEESTFYVREDLVKKWLPSLDISRIDKLSGLHVFGKGKPFGIGKGTILDLRSRMCGVYTALPLSLPLERDNIKFGILFEATGTTRWLKLSEARGFFGSMG